jgi:hypothetical protein
VRLKQPPDVDISGTTEHWQGLSITSTVSRVEIQIHMSHLAPSFVGANACIVRNAVRVAGMVASFMFRSQCEDVSGTQVSCGSRKQRSEYAPGRGHPI